MKERWFDIPGWEGYYQLSDQDRVRSVERVAKTGSHNGGTRRVPPRIKVPYNHPKMGPMFQLYRDDKNHAAKLANLKMAVFVRPPNPGECVLHWDDDSFNNDLSNLRYGTRKENAEDAIRNGKQINGSDIPWSKLTEDDVRGIAVAEGSTKAVADKYGVCASLVTQIQLGQIWKSVDRPVRKKKRNSSYYYQGHVKTLTAWAHLYGISPLTVSYRLRSGMSFHDALNTPVDKRRSRYANLIDLRN